MDEWEQHDLPLVSAHVLGEHVFCPRAALLARGTRKADDGEEDGALGPRLGGFEDLNERLFEALLYALWGRIRWNLTLLAPAIAIPLIVARLGWPLYGLILTLPAFYLLGRLWDQGRCIVIALREQAKMKAVDEVPFDPGAVVIREMNWWSLRKAGYDCERPAEPYFQAEQGLCGKPWRVLTKDTMRIPVVRKHRGEKVLRIQHIVRIIAYCRLIEVCEGVSSPFGVLLYGGSYDCVIVPRTPIHVEQFERALEDVQKFVEIYALGRLIPAPPTDNRCSGCPWGEPRQFVRGVSETIVNDTPVAPVTTKAVDKQLYHSPCGDVYRWVPNHELAEQLEIAPPK